MTTTRKYIMTMTSGFFLLMCAFSGVALSADKGGPSVAIRSDTGSARLDPQKAGRIGRKMTRKEGAAKAVSTKLGRDPTRSVIVRPNDDMNRGKK